MSFAMRLKGREMAYVTNILTIFGVLEQRQIRRMLEHMTDDEYSKLLARLYREGQIHLANGGNLLAASRLTMNRTDSQDSILCFEGFLYLKDKIRDICAGPPPAIVTITTKTRMGDIIPVSERNVEEINSQMDAIPMDANRFLVTRNNEILMKLFRRSGNDYVLFVREDGRIELHDL